MSDDAQEAALGLLGLTNIPTTPLIPQKRKHPMSSLPSQHHLHTTTATTTATTTTADGDDDEDGSLTDSIRCICGYTYDDGWSVACDRCGRWYHGACVEIAPGAVPQFWICPEHALERDPVEDQARKERAQAIQKQYQRKTALANEHSKTLKRRPSPGVERKQRRISSGEVKRRRRSMSKPVPPLLATQPPQPGQPGPTTTDEDEHVEIDVEDTFVQITQDAISLKETREKLSRNAQNWRGITALDVVEEDSETYVQPTSRSSIKPSFSLHTAAPVRTNGFIAPYTSTVTPSSEYLSDPLNAYAHLGMPKPFVHLIGPPHNVALDSRIRGNRARFARSGCNPNSVLRPYLCGDNISFGIFALRDLRENEEVVLGWEWDDGNAIHHLPAVLEHPELFTQEQQQYLRFQLANLLHSLGSTFATCACGNDSKQCALKRITDFVDGVIPEGEKSNMGPLVGVKRGFQTKERVPRSSGMYGVEMVHPPASTSSSRKDDDAVPMEEGEAFSIADELRFNGVESQIGRTASPAVLERAPDIKGKSKAVDGPTPPETEDLLPPRMRKRWNRQRRETLTLTMPTPPEPEPIRIDPPSPSSERPPQSPQPSASHSPLEHPKPELQPPPPPIQTQTQTPAQTMPAPTTPAPRKQTNPSPPTFMPFPPPPLPPPQTPLSLPPQTQAAISSLLTLSSLPPAPSPSAQFANLSLYSPAFAGHVPPATPASPSITLNRTLPVQDGNTASHVRFATSPPVVHPISSPPPSSSHDLDVEMKNENESRSPSPSPRSSHSPRSPRSSPSPDSSRSPQSPRSPVSAPTPPPPTAQITSEMEPEVEPTSAHSASRSQSPNLSPRFENKSLSPATTPSPLQSTLLVPAKERDGDIEKDEEKQIRNGIEKEKDTDEERESEKERESEETPPPPTSSPLPTHELALNGRGEDETVNGQGHEIMDGQAHETNDSQGHETMDGQGHDVMNGDEMRMEKQTVPQPPPQPKVKMSLKDFAMRRKKQREEKAAVELTPQPEEPTKDVEKAEVEQIKEEKDAESPKNVIGLPKEKERERERDRKSDVDAEVLKQAHINRSTLCFGSFGIDDDFIMNSEDSKLEGSSSIDLPPPVYEKPINIIPDTPQSPSPPGSSPLSISAHLPSPSPQPELMERKESQEEEGEITATPTPPLESNSISINHVQVVSPLSPSLVPVKNPPTQPRSFAMSSASPPPLLPSRRPPPPSLPLPSRPPPMAMSSRPPSGPRAFRQSFGNGITPPRGPLADRDRERERESWDRERERGVWNGRGRGRGSWVR